MFKFLRGRKTYVAAALAVLGAGAGYVTGDATAAQAAQMVLTAVLGATLRNSIR
jgi:VIT1/CCC1 family predicted Fe2+/Mn2+ transporter